MRTIASVALIIPGLFYSDHSYSRSAVEHACRITVEPYERSAIDRHKVFEFVEQKSLVVCPFSEGQPLTFLDPSCSLKPTNELGKATVEYFDSNNFFKEAIRCTPLMGIRAEGYKPANPVISYLFVENSEKFEPGKVGRDGKSFNLILRQFLNDIGAPIVYFNGISNVICLSINQNEKFSLLGAIREFGLNLPSTISIESSNSSCPDWVRERFNASLSEPVSSR